MIQAKLTFIQNVGWGAGLVVSVHAFYFDDLSSNPAADLNFQYERTKINEKEIWPIVAKKTLSCSLTKWDIFKFLSQCTDGTKVGKTTICLDSLCHAMSELHRLDGSWLRGLWSFKNGKSGRLGYRWSHCPKPNKIKLAPSRQKSEWMSGGCPFKTLE